MKSTDLEASNALLQWLTRRDFLKTAASGLLLYSTVGSAGDDAPQEPENLDQPTAWQDGDPTPRESMVPAVEPQQTADEAPPCQPMDDQPGDPPSLDYTWVDGYWWWTNGEYVWVPGYWAVPPEPDYGYAPGYWEYQQTRWVYFRGGWVVVGATTIVAYAAPREVVWVYVVPAPARIVRRHRSWARRQYWRRNPAPAAGGRPVQQQRTPAPRAPRRGGRRR